MPRKIQLDFMNIYNNEYISEGKTIVEISKKYNISHDTLSRGFKKLGLITRTTKINYSNINRNAFDIWSEEMAYWLGFIAADGSVHKDRNSLTVLINRIDEDHLLKLKRFLNLPDDCLKNRDILFKGTIREAKLLYCSDKYLISKLKDLGIKPDKSHHYIDYFTLVPNQYILPFLIGYFDGDGTINKNNRDRYNVRYEGNSVFLNQIVEYFHTVHNMSFVKVNPNKNTTVSLRWGAIKDVRKFCTLYNEIANKELLLKRKREIVEHVYSTYNYKQRSKKQLVCKNCLSVISKKTLSGLCNPCVRASKRKVERPSKDELIELLRYSNYSVLAKKFNVSSNAIKKWAKSYGII